MNKKRSLKSILFLDFAVFAVLSAVYYFFFQIRFIPFSIAWFFIGIVYISHDLGGRKTFEKPNRRVGRNGLSYGRQSDFW